MSQDDFVNDLMKHIIEGVKIPKVQVERAINPILSLFIENVLDKYFENNNNYSGSFKLVSPEFPLKKENNQSTNIDYLLVNNSKQLLVFFELKTDISSLDIEQMHRYLEYKRIISDRTALILKANLSQISNASSKSSKYNYIVSRFDSAIKNAEKIKNVIIIYLVPKAIKDQIKEKGIIDFVLNYGDLPKDIDHKYSNYWKDVRNNLLDLDNFFKTKPIRNNTVDPLEVIVNNIKKYVGSSLAEMLPVSVRLGIKGDGFSPNYQVKFKDGSVKTFRYSGKPHNVKEFNPNNLGVEYLWEDIKEKA